MKKIGIVLLLGELLVSISLLSSCSKQSAVEWNNDKTIEESVTVLYTDDFLEDFFTNRLSVAPVPRLNGMNEYIKTECVRKTYQGYYAVFLSETGRALLVFFDENGKYRSYEWNQAFFSTKEDFERIVRVGVTVRGDIMGTIGGANYSGGSGLTMTVQVVEGAFRLKCWTFLESPSYSPDSLPGMVCKLPVSNSRIVNEIDWFLSNEELEIEGISEQFNYVLMQDKEFLSRQRWWERENEPLCSESFDPFNELVVLETGYNGNGLAAPYLPDNQETRRYSIDTAGHRGFSNGDTVTLYAFSYLPIGNCITSSDFQEMDSLRKYCMVDLMKTTGMKPSRVFYEYTFANLPDLIVDVRQLDTKGIDSVVEDALKSLDENEKKRADSEGWRPVQISVYPSYAPKTQEKCTSFIVVLETGEPEKYVVLGTHFVGVYSDGSVKKIYDYDQWTFLTTTDEEFFTSLEDALAASSSMFPIDGDISTITF